MEGFAQQDEWMLDSLERYENLYMYELQYPTQCMEWSQDGTAVCVAGFSHRHGNELLQLALPERLLPPSRQSLCARRDFKMLNGGFTASAVSSLRHLPLTDVIASCGDSATVSLWSSDAADTALLSVKNELELKPWAPGVPTPGRCLMDHSPSSLPTSLLAGLTCSPLSLQLIDIATCTTTFQLASINKEQESLFLHDLCFAGNSSSSFVYCCGPTGGLTLCDPNQPPAIASTASNEACPPSSSSSSSSSSSCPRLPDTDANPSPHAPPSKASPSLSKFAVAVSNEPLPLAKLARLSSAGELCLFDLRKFEKPYSQTDISDGGRFTSSLPEHISVQFSQFAGSSRVSVSGPCRGVKVLSTTSWDPIFTHTGHEEENTGAHVLVHQWGPLIEGGCQDIIYSADSEGSMHAWQWRQ